MLTAFIRSHPYAAAVLILLGLLALAFGGQRGLERYRRGTAERQLEAEARQSRRVLTEVREWVAEHNPFQKTPLSDADVERIALALHRLQRGEAPNGKSPSIEETAQIAARTPVSAPIIAPA